MIDSVKNFVKQLVTKDYWKCDYCRVIKFHEQEMLCWNCKRGQMIYEGDEPMTRFKQIVNKFLETVLMSTIYALLIAAVLTFVTMIWWLFGFLTSIGVDALRHGWSIGGQLL